LKEGVSALIQRTITAATKTMLNVYNKILALLGKDVADEARRRVTKWLDEIRQAGKIELFGRLVGKLYQVDALVAVLPGWLEKTKANVVKINATTTDVGVLSNKFTLLVGRINRAGDVVRVSQVRPGAVSPDAVGRHRHPGGVVGGARVRRVRRHWL